MGNRAAPGPFGVGSCARGIPTKSAAEERQRGIAIPGCRRKRPPVPASPMHGPTVPAGGCATGPIRPSGRAPFPQARTVSIALTSAAIVCWRAAMAWGCRVSTMELVNGRRIKCAHTGIGQKCCLYHGVYSGNSMTLDFGGKSFDSWKVHDSGILRGKSMTVGNPMEGTFTRKSHEDGCPMQSGIPHGGEIT